MLTGVNVCDGFLPGEYRSRTLCLYAAVMSLCTRLFRSPCDAGLNAVDHTRTPGSPVRTVMSEIHDSPGWHTGAYTGCILIPKSASTKTAADKFDAYVSMFTMNYPSLSVLKCIRHFLRSLFWFSRHYAMAVSGYRYGRISRHVSRKAWLCKGSCCRLPFLLISSIRLKTNSFVSTSGF